MTSVYVFGSGPLAKATSTGVRAWGHAVTQEPAGADVIWIAEDMPVDATGRTDVAWLFDQLADLRPQVQPGVLVLLSSQVPVGTARRLAERWPEQAIVSAPENIRRNNEDRDFQNPARIVVGADSGLDRARVEAVFGPLAYRLVWMSLESAEMAKHALNTWLALSICFANEMAQVCSTVGADYAGVERALRLDARVGPGAYVAAGPADGRHVLRDVRYLLTVEQDMPTLAALLVSRSWLETAD